MIDEKIKAYATTNKRPPSRIVIFHNGSLDGTLSRRKVVYGDQGVVTKILSGTKKKYGDYAKVDGPTTEEVDDIKAQLKDGEIMEVIEVKTAFGQELDAIQKAIKANDCSPALTIISCNRGHSTRFYPKEDETATLTSPPAGTVVDVSVVGPYMFEFFLQTHTLPEGQDGCVTPRSTKYTVVYDENKFSADELQRGVNDLCHLSNVEPGSISLALPAHWAYKAAHHALAYLHEYEYAMDEFMMKEVAKQDLEKNSSAGFVHQMLKESMFYV